MKRTFILLPLIACSVVFASGKGATDPAIRPNTVGDTADIRFAATVEKKVDSSFIKSSYTLSELSFILEEKKPVNFVLGTSKLEREIGAWYFPGTSEKRALIIAGVHGSELSSVEVAFEIIDKLFEGEQPYYSVIVVPTLFPDNALQAMGNPTAIGSVANVGRYTFSGAVDPNRQLPSPGKPFDANNPLDHIGREIEKENQLLLQLIQEFKPHRVANLHAIRNTNYGGVYADPRTDHMGVALGFETDSKLALSIARAIEKNGGNVHGNNLRKKPTALYYKDPTPAPAGQVQKRNMTSSMLKANRGSGVSLGTWGATAVYDEERPEYNRPAMRILTIEYPGCKRPTDYTKPLERKLQKNQVTTYAMAIYRYFLGEYYVEEDTTATMPK